MTAWESAQKLVQSTYRFDIPFKIAYVRTTLSNNWEHETARYFYLKSIEAFNGHFEEDPRKVGPSEFLRAFDDLIAGIKSHGYQPSYGPILVNGKRDPVNGAHRLAICSHLNLHVQTEVSNLEADYDQVYFSGRGLGALEQYYGLSQLLNFNPQLRWLVVHSIVPDALNPLIEQVIQDHCRVYYRFNRKLSDVGLFNLKYVNYSHDADGKRPRWLGSAEANFPGLQEHAALSSGTAETRFYLVRPHVGSSVEMAKRCLRELDASGNYGFHSSDSYGETQRISETFAHSVTFGLFNEIPFPTSALLERQLDVLSRFIGDRSISRSDFCIGGSAPLAVLGIREANDLDVVVPRALEEQWQNPPEGISIHHNDDAPYAISPEEVCAFPANFFYFSGYKFVSPAVVAQMKANRREDKDIIDLSLLFDRFEIGQSISVIDLHKARKRTLARQRRLRLILIAARIPLLPSLYRFAKRRLRNQRGS